MQRRKRAVVNGGAVKQVGHTFGKGIRNGIETGLNYGYDCGKHTGDSVTPFKRKQKK